MKYVNPQAKPSQAKPSQAKPSQAKPSQAKPSQAQSVSRNKHLASRSNLFWGKVRETWLRIVPESSFLHKRILFAYHSLMSSKRNARRTRLSLAYITNDDCNLNCKYCSAYSPLVKEPQMVDLAQAKQDMMRLRELFGAEGVELLTLMGGESLLHPNIIEIMAFMREILPNTNIRLLTNGILLTKMSAEFWKCCYENRVHVMITPYPIKLDYERIVELAEEHDVNLTHFITSVWTRDKDVFRKLTLDPAGKSDVNKSFKRCGFSQCYTMGNGGRVYNCSQSALIGLCNDYFDTNFELTEKDYVDIYKVSNKEEIFDFLAKPVPFCRYCDTDKWEFGLPGGHSKKEIGEWM